MNLVKPPLPTFQYIALYQLFLALVIAIQPRVVWRFLAFLLILYHNLKIVTYTTGDIDGDYALSVAFGCLVATALHLLLVTNPMDDTRHVNDLVPPGNLPFWRKAYWAFCLQNSIRGIGWNYEVPHPPTSHKTRWAYVVSQSLRALQYFLTIDAAQSYICLNPLFSSSLSVSGALPVTAQGYVFRCVNIIAWMGKAYCSIRLQHTLLGIICVAIGFYDPKDFPPLFGRWREACTLRQFWGRVWHQMMRRFVASIGKSVARNVNFEPGSRLSSYTQLYVGFAVSGLAHMLGDAMVGMQYLGTSFPFFLAQAVAITVEDAVIGLARRAGIAPPSYLTRVVGYAWVFIWFSISAPWLLNWQIAAGLGLSEAMPVSPVRHAARMLNETIKIDIVPYLVPL